MPQLGKYAIISVLHKNSGRKGCGKYRGISLVAYAGKVLLKIIARRLSEYWERMGVLPWGQSGCRPNCSITDMMFVIHGLRELARKNNFLCMYTLSTLPKRTAPSIKPSYRQYSPVLTCHKILSRSFVNSTMPCKHVFGSTTGCTRGGSLWNRAFVKCTCSRPFCLTYFSWLLLTWPARVSRRTKTLRTLWYI